MTLQNTYIYTFKYDYHHTELCKLETRQVFGEEEVNKVLFSNKKVDATISPFIKNRFDISLEAKDYSELVKKIKERDIHIDDFKVEYLKLPGDTIEHSERQKKLRDIGYCIEGDPDFKKPKTTYSICHYNNIWYFGLLTKHNPDWHKHKKKPCSFSNSLDIIFAKTMVSMTSEGDKSNCLLDACCGVGTVLLEACFCGFNIEGCEISEPNFHHTNQNLEHYNYKSLVHHLDIKDLNKKYDGAIVDLPYNLYAYSTDAITQNIIRSVSKLTNRIIIVSISDISPMIKEAGLKVIDSCTVEKRGSSKFERTIWVCIK